MKKTKRKIIHIDEALCDGCGNCIPACPEQAIQIVETSQGPKARLVKELYCDGLGACLGNCPTGALTIEEREAEPYDDKATIQRIKKVAPEMLDTHVQHMKEHGPVAAQPNKFKVPCSCPSTQMMQWDNPTNHEEPTASCQGLRITLPSELRQWPVQLHLVPVNAPYFQNSDLVLVADCVPIAYANFHQNFLKGKAVAIACPKLDDTEPYLDKLTQILKTANLKSLKVVHMEVPCCFGLVQLAQQAIKDSGQNIPFEDVTIGIKGEIKEG